MKRNQNTPMTEARLALLRAQAARQQAFEQRLVVDEVLAEHREIVNAILRQQTERPI